MHAPNMKQINKTVCLHYTYSNRIQAVKINPEGYIQII